MANNKERRLSGVSATANGVSTSAGKSALVLFCDMN